MARNIRLTPEQIDTIKGQLRQVHALKAWIEDQRDAQVEILVANPDHAQLLKAQGAVAMLERLQRLIG